MRVAGTLQHTYRYAFSSRLEGGAPAPGMRLATSGGVAEFPFFFQGALKEPRLTAHLLRVLSKVVGARYHMPAAMLERILRECDPVVTSGGGMLRFEGFSACASVYARVDLNPDAYVGVVTGHGTTNVDFNAPFRAALAQIREGEQVGLAVGAEDVTLLRGAEQSVERKVELPLRWLKGFAEVQAFQSRLEFRWRIGKIETLRFLRSLPRSTIPGNTFWIVPAGNGLRAGQRASAGAVRVSGIERLRVLEELAPWADGLRVYAAPNGMASEWHLEFGPRCFALTLSADAWRGFSGEGQVLSELANAPRDAVLERVRRSLRWQAELRADDFGKADGLTPDAIRCALAVLGSRGLVGYDVARGAYFHRELPFDLSAVEELHPRLAGARALIARGAAKIVRRAAGEIEAEVAGSDVVHRVRLSADGFRCTCPWHAKHQGERGPCKHLLAAQLLLEEEGEAFRPVNGLVG